jgi:hypothetical protein
MLSESKHQMVEGSLLADGIQMPMKSIAIVTNITPPPIDLCRWHTLRFRHKKTKEKEQKMKIKASLWDSTKTRILGIENFANTKELQDFMKELQVVEPKASYRIMEVAK